MLYSTISLLVILFTGAAAGTSNACYNQRDCKNGGTCQRISSPAGSCICTIEWIGPHCEGQRQIFKHDFEAFEQFQLVEGTHITTTASSNTVPNTGYNGTPKFGSIGPGSSFGLSNEMLNKEKTYCAEFGYYISGEQSQLQVKLFNKLVGASSSVWKSGSPDQGKWLYAKFSFVNLPKSALVIRGTTSNDAMSKVAIDQIRIYEGACK